MWLRFSSFAAVLIVGSLSNGCWGFPRFPVVGLNNSLSKDLDLSGYG
jgi:hypothetical protein